MSKEGKDMKVIITTKNVKANEHLKETIEKKMQKLSKYFSDDIDVNVMLSAENKMEKMEATIRVRNMVFRAEGKADSVYNCVDKVVDKLATQMSRFKNKLIKKHKGQPGLKLEDWPEPVLADDVKPAEELKVVKKKKFELEPMSVDEAVVQMELVGHTFFVFLNSETDAVNVVYKREDGDYGILETKY